MYKNTNSLDIYVNGQLANSVKHDLGSGDKAYQLFVGQMDFYKEVWQLHGSIDEIALYDRPLSPQEIKNHYRYLKNSIFLVTGGNRSKKYGIYSERYYSNRIAGAQTYVQKTHVCCCILL